MVPVTDKDLIYCRADLGPCFGSGCPDLGMFDNLRAFGKFPGIYNKEGPNKYIENQSSYTAFTGVKNGWQLKITEYEVFRVYFKWIEVID